MKKLSALGTLLLLSLLSFSQVSLSGHVVDADTKLPLEGASVFAQNTTKGVITDKEGAYRLSLPAGGYELIVSYTGYVSRVLPLEARADQQLEIELKKEEKSMGEVVVTTTNRVADGWEKHGSFFLEHFIGKTPGADSCVLLNPEVLEFFWYKRSEKLKVLATEPLLIANRALGYNLRYTLDSFLFFHKTGLSTYRGSCFYQPMEGDSVTEARWADARLQAYTGSRLHFLRAYYDSNLVKEGFTVDLLSETDQRRFHRLSNPYDTIYYLFNDSTAAADLFFPRKVSITYTKKAPEPRYLKSAGLPADVPVQISYVDLLESILIQSNGFFFDQRSWINQGYWSWKNLADQLPYDYEPE
ncbi:MAG TPA: carboxypeptidase-like regulatory domain-containing protein [Chitinophagaceae bacterium]|jgi:hypothetical protein|nr:carboxypeptidase-like regulatory domain-containing protein [Chitinophagaceae bacterium]